MRYNPSNHRYIRLGLVWLGAFFLSMVALNYINKFLEAPFSALLVIASLGCAAAVYKYRRFIL